MIDFSLNNVKVPGLDSELFSFWLNSVAKEEGYKVDALSIIFCSDDELLEMNIQYLNHDYFTDIITFDYSEDEYVSGDLFISIDRIIDNSTVLNVNYQEELKRVCVHGLLHLCKYSDKTETAKKRMREKENYYLQKFVSRET